jgi:hypothetical protein
VVWDRCEHDPRGVEPPPAARPPSLLEEGSWAKRAFGRAVPAADALRRVRPCRLEGIEGPTRARRAKLGLEIGEAADAGLFRYRAACDHGCGRLNLPMSLDWSALSALPNHGYGRPDLYALRVALEAHRNISEAGFSSLEVGHKLLGKDGARTRLLSKDVNEAFLLARSPNKGRGTASGGTPPPRPSAPRAHHRATRDAAGGIGRDSAHQLDVIRSPASRGPRGTRTARACSCLVAR